jgi:hypothetical protein
MRRLVSLCLVVGILATAGPAQQPDDATAWAQYRSIKVLYAGWPGGSREHAFEAFLQQWFDEVKVIDLKALSVASAAPFDVVIADWCSQYGNDGYPTRENQLSSAPVQLGTDFTKPIIAMDYVSSNLRGRYKLDWL